MEKFEQLYRLMQNKPSETQEFMDALQQSNAYDRLQRATETLLELQASKTKQKIELVKKNLTADQIKTLMEDYDKSIAMYSEYIEMLSKAAETSTKRLNR